MFRAGIPNFGSTPFFLKLVECELLANLESRREVIGQNIEYAANAVQLGKAVSFAYN